MKLTTGVRLLRLLNTRPENALTTREIERRWRDLGGTAVDLRSIQRYMSDLSQDSSEGPALVAVVQRGAERAYYLKTSQVANWFMTEEAALDLQLSRDVFGRAFGSRGHSSADKLADMAERVVAASPQTQRIRSRLRIAPDGIGRLPAWIEPDVLRAAIDAIGKDRKLRFTYASASGKASSQLVSPLGLVAKDGTIYLVAVKGLSDVPRHFALQRMSVADVHFQQAQPRPEFDLQQYILDSHQFSHVLDDKAPPVALKLRVAPESIYHFRERPLSGNQRVMPPEGDEPWHIVTATVPQTMLLLPFLVSMGPWIEVLAPAHVRAETAGWVGQMWAHYARDEAAG
jgi:predicted DNA-binding transcriptional regulator YafY